MMRKYRRLVVLFHLGAILQSARNRPPSINPGSVVQSRRCEIAIQGRPFRNQHKSISILEWIELALAGHRDRERPQRVEHPHRGGMMGENLRKPAICHRTFVEVSPHQNDAALPQPAIHLAAGKSALGLLAAEQAPGAMDGGVERCLRLWTVNAFKDHRIVPHGAADEPALPRKS